VLYCFADHDYLGDWVHITNPNDLTKPIVAQIFRTYIDKAGKQCVNACWYYRPELTVHRFEKHFFENEVVKTGQYRDHGVEEIVDRCFVMFMTRYNKGRPRGLPKDKEVYVCEARYNEEKHKLNKIKTWASCLPDEVRDKDYEMDLFDVPRRLKKIPSPIKHLLRDDAKPGDPLPKPTWGAPNAPPLVGAVHCRQREANVSRLVAYCVFSHNISRMGVSAVGCCSPPFLPAPFPPALKHVCLVDAPWIRCQTTLPKPPAAQKNFCSTVSYQESPPPEPTPPPVPIDPTRRPSMMQGSRPIDGQGDVAMGNAPHYTPVPVPPTPTPNGSYAPQFSAARPSPTPIPVPQYGGHPNMHQAPPPMPQTPHYPAQQTQQTPGYNGFAPPYNPAPAHHQSHHPPPINTPIIPYDPNQRLAPLPARSAVPPPPVPGMHGQPNSYNPPRSVEVYTLDDAIDARIPLEIRQQFQRDEQGRVLFFTQPPLDRAHPGLSSESAGLGHSIRYLADRARGIEDRRAKRRARDELRRLEEGKRRELEEEELAKSRAMAIDVASDALINWVGFIDKENAILKAQYDGWSVKDEEIDKFGQK
jgi:chromatin structure-remodeling complex subunit RSC1/2